MKRQLTLILCALAAVIAFISCSDTETYADKRKKEDAAISQFISRNSTVSKALFTQPITVISETDFEKADYSTDTTRNEFVLFETSGVYMQIIRKGCGEKIKSGETTTVLCRYREYNILGDSLQSTNEALSYHYLYDKMTVVNSYGTFTGVFDASTSMMYYLYTSTSVPSGWLVPLRYVNVGRQQSPDDRIAKVRIIVPAAQGQYYASANTYPCYYELTYERGI